MLEPQNSMEIKKDRRVKRKDKSSSKKKASSINNQTLTEDPHEHPESKASLTAA